MTDFSGFVLERSIDRGWEQFERWLTDVLGSMRDSDVLVVARENGSGEPQFGNQPHVQFCAWGDDLVRAEAASNRHLDRQFWLGDEDVNTLVELGYTPPSGPRDALATGGSTNFSIDMKREEAAVLAGMSVLALRDVFGVVHPAFLSFRGDAHQTSYDGGVGQSRAPDWCPGLPASGTPASQWSLTEAGPIAMPESPAHLRRLIEQALVRTLGRRPLVDEDGDFVIPCAGALVFVRVVETAPVVAVFSQLTIEVDAATAGDQVARLNASVEMVKFFLVDDRIVAGCTLPANPFVGEHLREMLSLVGRVASGVDEATSPLAHGGPAYGV